MTGGNVIVGIERQHHALHDDQYDASSECHRTREPVSGDRTISSLSDVPHAGSCGWL